MASPLADRCTNPAHVRFESNGHRIQAVRDLEVSEAQV